MWLQKGILSHHGGVEEGGVKEGGVEEGVEEGGLELFPTGAVASPTWCRRRGRAGDVGRGVHAVQARPL